MVAVIEWAKGKKTYLVIGAAGLVWVLAGLSVVSPGMAEQAYGFLTMLGGVTVAAKINRLRG